MSEYLNSGEILGSFKKSLEGLQKMVAYSETCEREVRNLNKDLAIRDRLLAEAKTELEKVKKQKENLLSVVPQPEEPNGPDSKPELRNRICDLIDKNKVCLLEVRNLEIELAKKSEQIEHLKQIIDKFSEKDKVKKVKKVAAKKKKG